MHSTAERRFAALIALGRVVRSWCKNVEPYQEVWTDEERSDAYDVIKNFTGRYLDIKSCTDEEIADAAREVFMRLLNGTAHVELVEAR